MVGLRTCEGEKFERFFADCGGGHDFSNEFMEGENTSGWLIPLEKADEFEKEFKKDWDGPKGWDEYFCWAEWKNEESPKNSFVWYD